MMKPREFLMSNDEIDRKAIVFRDLISKPRSEKSEYKLVREVLPGISVERKQGWSDVLKLIVSARPNPLKDCPELGCAEYRDWLESQLHILDAATKGTP